MHIFGRLAVVVAAFDFSISKYGKPVVFRPTVTIELAKHHALAVVVVLEAAR